MISQDTTHSDDTRPRVLIADDEAPVRGVLITFLNRLGYRTEAVENGHLALQAIQAGDVDLVISDYSMPILNGLELYDQMMQHTPELADKFILITGTAFTNEVIDFVECHQTPFLEKPFRLPDLASMVEHAIGDPSKESVGVS